MTSQLRSGSKRRSFGKLGLSAVAATALALAACTSPADQAQRFYENGKALLEQGDLTRARLEFQNALQLVSDMSGPLYGLALIAEQQGDWERMYSLLNRVIEQEPTHLDARVKLGQLLLAAGQLQNALDMSDAAMELAPELPAVLALRAAVLLHLEDHAGAVEHAQAALKVQPDNVEALVVLASERLAQEEPKSAIAFLDQALAQNPHNLAVRLLKIQALEKVPDPEGVEQAYREAIAAHPDVTGLRASLARFYLNAGRVDEAEVELRGIVEREPSNLTAKLDVVRFANVQRGAEQALKELEAFISAEPDNYELRFALSSFLGELGDRERSRAVLREIIGLAGDSDDGLRAKGILAAELLGEGDREGGERLVREILAVDPQHEQGLYLRASMAVDDRQLDQAIGDLRTILRDAPESARALMLLGRAHELAGSPELAEGQYLRAFQAGRFAPRFGLPYADFLQRRGNLSRAERVLEDVLRAAPGDVAALRMLAQIRLSQGNWAGAQQLADEIRQRGDQDSLAEQILGAVSAGRRDWEAGIAAFRRAHEATPHAAQPMVSLVRTYVAAGQAAEAERFIESVLRASPDNTVALLLKGQLQQLNGDFEGAIATFARVTEVSPADPAGYSSLAGAYARAQRIDEADEVLSQGRKALPEALNLHLMHASVKELTGRIDEAISIYEEILQRHPNVDVAANNLAALLAQHRTDRASYERAYALAQRFERSPVPHFRDTWGWVNYRLGNYDRAVAALQSAAQEMPGMAIFRYHLGMSYLAQANKEAARRELSKALELAENQAFPHAEQVRQALQELEATPAPAG